MFSDYLHKSGVIFRDMKVRDFLSYDITLGITIFKMFLWVGISLGIWSEI